MASTSAPSNSNTNETQHVVIAGAGIIGTCTAYYLAKNHLIRTTLVDPTGGIAPAASGKAGGFLALDWNDHSSTGPLTRRSFQLHQELANAFGAESIQYRRLTCAAVSVNPAAATTSGTTPKPKGKKLEGIEWAQPVADNGGVCSSSVVGVRPLGNEDTIAQVHPKKLCQKLWEATQSLVDGCVLKQGSVVGSKHDKDGRLKSIELSNGENIQADAILYACGPWTADIMYGIKYHSAVIPTDEVLSQCVFFSGCGDPEVYVRPDKTAYCTGFPEQPRVVTEKPGEEEVRKDKIESIVQSVREASGGRNKSAGGALESDPVLEQACYLPSTNDGLPVMGALPESVTGGTGCYIATGHTCWGILMGPASGESMASLIATGKSEYVNLQPFTPSRYRSIELVSSSKV